MLTETDKILLKEKLFTPEEIDKIDSYDERTGSVKFKDGTERTATSIYVRCMGYYRNVDNFNKGKKSEFMERVPFTEAKACPCERVAA